MSLREMIEHPPDIRDLPIWRKVLIACAFALFMFIGFASLDKDLTIYASAPTYPVAATGQVYPVSVEHGYIRYVTLAEKENPLVDGRAGSWAGAAFVGAFFLWITSRRKSA
jgi:hypothetical protein